MTNREFNSNPSITFRVQEMVTVKRKRFDLKQTVESHLTLYELISKIHARINPPFVCTASEHGTLVTGRKDGQIAEMDVRDKKISPSYLDYCLKHP